MDLGERFDIICETLGITYAEMAKQIGIDRPDKFYNMKAGKSKLNFETIEAILNRYPQLNANYIFGTSDDVLVNNHQQAPSETQVSTHDSRLDIDFLVAMKTLASRIRVLEAELDKDLEDITREMQSKRS